MGLGLELGLGVISMDYGQWSELGIKVMGYGYGLALGLAILGMATK